jgi:hypothetical protein
MKNIITAQQMEKILEIGILTNTNLLFIGGKGIGKTSITRQICEKLNRKLIEIRAAYSEAADFKGYPDKDGTDMIFLRPEDLPKEKDTGAVLFFDEINRAKSETMNCLMQVSDGSGKIGTHKLPDKLTVIGAMNPDNDKYSVNFLDAALLNRFAIFYVVSDADQLLEYAQKTEWNSTVCSFLKMKGTNLISEKLEGVDIDSECSPRSLHKLSILENSNLLSNKEMHLLFSKAIVGCGAGVEYHAFKYENAPLHWNDLLRESGWDRLERYVDMDGVCRTDLISETNNNIVAFFKNKKTSKSIEVKEWKILSKYFKKINADLAMALVTLFIENNIDIQSLILKDEDLVNHLETKIK